MHISKDPEHYRYSPPPERQQAAATVLAALFAVGISIPWILEVLAGEWKLGSISMKAIGTWLLTILVRRALRFIIDRVGRWAKQRWGGVAWEPSKNPDDYR